MMLHETKLVLRELGVDLGNGKKVGSKTFYKCPFHLEDTPSFNFKGNTTGNWGESFNCLGCNAGGGNMVDFIVQHKGCSSTEAQNIYNKSIGRKYSKDKTKVKIEDLPLIQQILKKAVFLKEPTEYLKSRKIKKIPEETLKFLNGEFFCKETKIYIPKQTLVIPIYNALGQIISLQTINPESEKPFQKMFLKGYSPENGFTKLIINKNPTIILVEAVIDGLSLNQAGYNALACYNADNLAKVAYSLRKQLRGNAYVFADNDNIFGEKNKNVGLEAALDASIILGGKGDYNATADEKTKVKHKIDRCIVSWEYKDVNDILCNKGVAFLKEFVKNHVGFGMYGSLKELASSGSLQAFLSSYEKKYYVFSKGKEVAEGANAAEVVNLLRTHLATHDMITKTNNPADSRKIDGEIKTYLQQETKMFRYRNYNPKYNFLEVYTEEGKSCLNFYQESGIVKKVKEDVLKGTFTDKVCLEEHCPSINKVLHFLTTFGEDTKEHAYHWLLQFLAYKVQRPWDKQGFGVIISGTEGMGKGSLGKLLHKMFGNNCNPSVSQKQIQSKFNTYLKDTLIWIGEEIADLGNKNNTGNELKDLITSKLITLDEKHDKQIVAYGNYSNPFLFSNEVEPIRISITDRRYLVLDVSPTLEQIKELDLGQLYIDFYTDYVKEAPYFVKYLLDLEIPKENERFELVLTDAWYRLVGISKNFILSLIESLSNNPRGILKQAQGLNKTGNRIPTMVVLDEHGDFLKDITSEETYLYAVELKEGKLYMNENLFCTLAKVLFEVKGNNRKILAEAAKDKEKFAVTEDEHFVTKLNEKTVIITMR